MIGLILLQNKWRIVSFLAKDRMKLIQVKILKLMSFLLLINCLTFIILIKMSNHLIKLIIIMMRF